MKKTISWLLVAQSIALLFGILFFDSVREELEPALIRQGQEIGRHQLIEELRDARVPIPEDIQVSRDKDALISPGIVSFGQNVTLLLPAALFQMIAIVLATRCLVLQSCRTSEELSATATNQAEQDGTGQPATRPESKSEGGDKPQPEAEGRSR